MKIIILFDWIVTDDSKHWLQAGLEKYGHEVKLNRDTKL